MKRLSFTIASVLFFMLTYGQSFDYGYKQTIVPQVEVSDESLLSVNPSYSTKTFFNGLGQKKQEIYIGQSANARDIIKFYEYDSFGRLSKDYLPYEGESQEQIIANPILEQSEFYLSAPRVAHSNYPFSEVEFDGSPLNIKEEIGSPGSWWQLDENSVHINFDVNKTEDYVKKFYLNVQENTQWSWNEGGFYDVGMLLVKEFIDEDGKISREYKDKFGRIVLTERVLDTNQKVRTYYLYDYKGRLSIVISPEGSKIVDGWTTFNFLGTDLIDKWCYQYIYDEKGRLVSKKIPGKAVTNYIYDKRDRIRLIQDGNLAPDKWKFFKYDKLDRLVLTGIFEPLSTKSLENMRSYIENYADGITTFEYEIYNQISTLTPHGYTCQSAPGNDGLTYDVLTVSYFDNYDFADEALIQDEYEAVPGFTNTPAIKTRGMLTGHKVKILDNTNQYLYSVNFYNRDGELIQNYSQNLLGSGFDQKTYQYNFNGMLTDLYHIHGGIHNEIGNTFETKYRIEYDHAGRMKEIFHKFENQAEVLMTSFEYNALGQLIAKNIHSEDIGNTFWQSIDYKYNIRGWLTKINDSNLGDDNIIIGLDESLSNLEMVSALELDSLSYDIKLITGKKPGTNQLKIEIKDLKIIEVNDMNSGASVNDQEVFEAEIIYVKENDPEDIDTYLALYPLSGNRYEINYSSLIFDSTYTALSYITLIHNINFDQLSQQGNIDSTQLIVMDNMINKYLMNTLGISFLNEEDDDLFGMDILYNFGPSSLNASNLYNGNISGVLWRNKGDEYTKGYGYQYDDLNRLKKATYAERGETGFWDVNEDYYSMEIPLYDYNGNIESLKRNTVINDLPTLMDDLSYRYEGNKLLQVDDAVNTGGAYEDFDDFGTNTPQTVEYFYDNNGNMVKDLNKEITVKYNHLDLPTEISFGPVEDDNKILYLYDAFGTKLKKQKLVLGTVETETVYVNDYVYDNSGLQKVLTPEGFMENIGSNSFEYHYFINDYLGNVRVEFKKDINSGDLVTLQDNHYYPYGMKFSGFLNNSNKYLYNSKELQDDGFDLSDGNQTLRKLNWLDYGWRMQDPQLGRWHVIDKLSEYYFSNSPYNYVTNSPIKNYDVDGLYGDDEYGYEYNYELDDERTNENDNRTFWEKLVDFFTFGSNDDKLENDNEEDELFKSSGTWLFRDDPVVVEAEKPWVREFIPTVAWDAEKDEEYEEADQKVGMHIFGLGRDTQASPGKDITCNNQENSIDVGFNARWGKIYKLTMKIASFFDSNSKHPKGITHINPVGLDSVIYTSDSGNVSPRMEGGYLIMYYMDSIATKKGRWVDIYDDDFTPQD
jgi:hypothetical protein